MNRTGSAAIQEPQYTIQAHVAPPIERTRVLKCDNTFGVFDQYGDVGSDGRPEEGVFHKGTRYLSRLRLTMLEARPLLLSSTVRQDNVVLAVDLTNPDVLQAGHLVLPHGAIHIYRTQFLWDAALHMAVRVKNFGLTSITLDFALEYGADFCDIFEVRGEVRERRGSLNPPKLLDHGHRVELSYEGLDHVVRRTQVEASRPIATADDLRLRFELDLKPGEEHAFEFRFSFIGGRELSGAFGYGANLGLATNAIAARNRIPGLFSTSNEFFNTWLARSRSDLNMLLTSGGDGLYPYAGVPWFSTPFGRDGIITALECLWVAPQIARGVLRYLADTQAKTLSPEQDAQPGKILHEARDGEMAALGEVPFAKYYGSVDSTPLFVVLAAAYFRRTADLEFIESIWPNIQLALKWLTDYGDVDGDGFVEYSRLTPRGLAQQGWKDSHDSVFHADGSAADPPIALCEVQAYTFAAKRGAARLASALGQADLARNLRAEARALQERFEEEFWCESIGTYALALDKNKQQCKVRTSNAGQCLFTGICSREHALKIAHQLSSDIFFNGWGIRTVAEGEAHYNPMSYHNGSVWPHDNALIALGFAKYHMTQMASKLLRGFFEGSAHFDLQRLPELFCGFQKRQGKAPTLYPVACSPQAWSAASAYLLLEASIGLSIDAVHRRIVLTRPVLPDFLECVRVQNLEVNGASVDLSLFRSAGTVAATVERRSGDVEVLVIH